MDVSMPPVVVLIVCKTLMAHTPVPETGYEGRAWAIEDGKMQCRREEIALTSMGDDTFSMQDCMRAGIMMIPAWDAAHKGGSYRAWRVACPTPIKNYGKDGIKGTRDDETIGWQLPDCGRYEQVVCEKDIAI